MYTKQKQYIHLGDYIAVPFVYMATRNRELANENRWKNALEEVTLVGFCLVRCIRIAFRCNELQNNRNMKTRFLGFLPSPLV